MRRNTLLVLAVTFLLLEPQYTAFAALDAGMDGPVYGDPIGLARVEKLESELRNLSVRTDHPRIFVNAETIWTVRDRWNNDSVSRKNILALADAKDMVNAAFAALMYRGIDNTISGKYTAIARDAIASASPATFDKTVGKMALAYDWIYNGLTTGERSTIEGRLNTLADISGRLTKFQSFDSSLWGETFHREEWVFYTWNAWPEIALAHHVSDAEPLYKARWHYKLYWGDAARMMAYVGDGTMFEGYYYGADGAGWFYALKSATGINLIDDVDYPWVLYNTYNILYRLDLGKGREFFHHGVGLGGAGLSSYTNGTSAWKMKEYYRPSFEPASSIDPYIQWFYATKLLRASEWTLSNEYFGYLGNMTDIANVLFFDSRRTSKSPTLSTRSELPLGMLFKGGNEVYARSGWTGDDLCVGFRANAQYTKTSHGDFDVNSFMLYRKGNLSTDTGGYDAYGGQSHYRHYQSNTIAHNDILVIDPSNPNGPTKLSGGAPDPGGTDLVTNRSFSGLADFNTVFVHDSKADWGNIDAFESNNNYVYAVGNGQKAYQSRVSEYLRHFLFIPKGTGGYVVVFDRVTANNSNCIKKWLLHTTTEPVVVGTKTSTQVSSHIDTWSNVTKLSSTNVDGNSELLVWPLLPSGGTLRRVGGIGYEYWVDGTTPTNWPITGATDISNTTSWIDGTMAELGTWRVEISPTILTKSDYFLNVLYAGAPGNSSTTSVSLVDELSRYGAVIRDTDSVITVKFNKSSLSGGHITIVMSGSTVVDKELATDLPAPVIRTSVYPDAFVNKPYMAPTIIFGNAAPYTLSIIGGTLPPGMTVDGHGQLVGTPTDLGSYSFTMRAIDSNGVETSKNLNVHVVISSNVAPPDPNLRVPLAPTGVRVE